jgi:hypothetical protein
MLGGSSIKRVVFGRRINNDDRVAEDAYLKHGTTHRRALSSRFMINA